VNHARLLALLAALALPACSSDSSSDGGTDPDASARSEMDAKVPDEGVYTDPDTLPDGAPNPCLGAGNCEECTARTPCGWCNNRCLAGTATRSFDGTCSGAQWMWRGVQCPGTGVQCPMHTDCLSCASDPNSCGWCANVRRCVAGDRAGPAQPVEGCGPSAGTWVYNLEQQMCP
jgi:hypothetical protein